MDARDMGLRSAMINAFVSEVGQVPDSAEVEISRRGVRLTKAGHDRFLDRMMELLDELSAQEPPESDEDAIRYSIFMAVHPETYSRPKT
jgi:hypothetical protein